VTSVWVGFTPEKTVVINGKTGFGGTVAAPIWARFMKAALDGQPSRDFASASDPSYDPGSFNIPVSKETQNPTPVPTKATNTNTTTTTKSKSSSGTIKKRKKTKTGGGGSKTTTGTP
jgi:membrane carboxypeptidase/penicillin-binding protein